MAQLWVFLLGVGVDAFNKEKDASHWIVLGFRHSPAYKDLEQQFRLASIAALSALQAHATIPDIVFQLVRHSLFSGSEGKNTLEHLKARCRKRLRDVWDELVLTFAKQQILEANKPNCGTSSETLTMISLAFAVIDALKSVKL